MPRVIEFEHPVDTSTFSAIQLQPRVAASLTWSALARWLRAHLMSFPELIGKERTGLVVMGFHLEYLDRLSFFDCEAIRVRAGLRVMRRGERAVLTVSLAAEAGRVATARLVLCPVSIEEPTSLAASPAPLNDRLLDRFDADEVDAGSPARLVPDRRAAVEARYRLLAEGVQPFVIRRHHTEVADQWSWVEVTTIVEAARESLAFDPASPPAARRCLSDRVRRFDVEFGRPFFSFEHGETVSRVYDGDRSLGLVHRLTSSAGTAIHATAVEVFG